MDLQLGLFPDHVDVAKMSGVVPAVLPETVTALAALVPDGVRLGTSSWSFPGWEGLVYQGAYTERRLAREGLTAYASHPLFRTVGLDRTFYRSIEHDAYRRYSTSVPEAFRFVVKADRLLTSPTDPHRYGVRDRNPHFLDPHYARTHVIEPMVKGLGHSAGVILFQFPPIPPNLVGGPEAFVERLHSFLSALPDVVAYAVEIRTSRFLTPQYATCLRDCNATHGYSIHPTLPDLSQQFQIINPLFQPLLLIRWMLGGGGSYEATKEAYQPFDRLVREDAVSRRAIAEAVLDAVLAERPAFIIANNKAEGSAPLSVLKLAEAIAHWRPDTSTTRI